MHNTGVEAVSSRLPTKETVSTVKEEAKLFAPPRNIMLVVAVLCMVLMMMTGSAMAQSNLSSDEQDLRDTLQNIGDFISVVVLGVAVPNGAYGFLQYMTAGSNVEQDEKGRKRIRNTFIGLAGVAVIQIAVRIFSSQVGVTSP